MKLDFTTPPLILQIPNEKARNFLSKMRKKQPVPFSRKFPNIDPLALRILERLLAFDPKNRPSAKEVGLYNLYMINYKRRIFIDK